jgi:hypothetical protein
MPRECVTTPLPLINGPESLLDAEAPSEVGACVTVYPDEPNATEGVTYQKAALLPRARTLRARCVVVAVVAIRAYSQVNNIVE